MLLTNELQMTIFHSMHSLIEDRGIYLIHHGISFTIFGRDIYWLILHMYIILGANDVIAFNSDDKIYELEERDLLLKELTIREHYDVVFLTTEQTYNRDFISKFLRKGGIIIDTVEKRLSSDEYGLFMRFLCSVSWNSVVFDMKCCNGQIVI